MNSHLSHAMTPLRHRAVLAEPVHVLGRVGEIARLLARQDVLDGAVDEEIRVAPDGRGEVDVLRQSEAEVSEVVRLIRGAGHGPEQHGFDQRSVELALDALEHLGEVPGLKVLDPRERHAEGREKGLQLFEPLLPGLVVDAVQRGDLVTTQESSRGHVGRDHALFDHPVGIVAFVGADRLDSAILAELDVGLRDVEVDGAPFAPLGEERAKNVVQVFKARQERRVLPPQLRVAVEEHGRNFLVGKPFLGEHDALEEARPRDPPVAPHSHLADHAEAIGLRVERAEPVREKLRQHRQDPAREVD
jgi:hypothetical protein